MGSDAKKKAVKQVESKKNRRGGNGRGVKQANTAMDQKLANEFDLINTAIWDKAVKGDLSAARMVFSLATKSGEGKALAKRRMESLAARLAAEPEWVSESSEENAEMAGGSREPEN